MAAEDYMDSWRFVALVAVCLFLGNCLYVGAKSATRTSQRVVLIIGGVAFALSVTALVVPVESTTASLSPAYGIVRSTVDCGIPPVVWWKATYLYNGEAPSAGCLDAADDIGLAIVPFVVFAGLALGFAYWVVGPATQTPTPRCSCPAHQCPPRARLGVGDPRHLLAPVARLGGPDPGGDRHGPRSY
jgi:hypothetical protein